MDLFFYHGREQLKGSADQIPSSSGDIMIMIIFIYYYCYDYSYYCYYDFLIIIMSIIVATVVLLIFFLLGGGVGSKPILSALLTPAMLDNHWLISS